MPALVAGIHVLSAGQKDVDGRDKPGHDEVVHAASTRLKPFHSAVAAPDISTGM
jgi:hypothetical protein